MGADARDNWFLHLLCMQRWLHGTSQVSERVNHQCVLRATLLFEKCSIQASKFIFKRDHDNRCIAIIRFLRFLIIILTMTTSLVFPTYFQSYKPSFCHQNHGVPICVGFKSTFHIQDQTHMLWSDRFVPLVMANICLTHMTICRVISWWARLC